MEWPFQLFAQILIFLTDTTATFVRNVEIIVIIIVNIVIVIIINIIVFNRSVRPFRINRNIPRLTDGRFATPYPDVQYRKKKDLTQGEWIRFYLVIGARIVYTHCVCRDILYVVEA